MESAIIGGGCQISPKASFYGEVKIGNNVRIDDFCVIAGKITIGDNLHIGCGTRMIGEVTLEDFASVSFGVSIFSCSDDFSGRFLVGPTIPEKYRGVTKKPVLLKRHSLVGCNSVIMPGVTLHEGAAIGAMSLVRKTVPSWSIWGGNPLRFLFLRDSDCARLADEYMKENFLDYWTHG